ncbi:copia protein [Tanacetum coccineum]
MIIKKDSKIVKAKGERKSLALKAKKESSDEECSTSGSEDEEYVMTARDFKKFIKRRDLPKDKNQRAFVEGSWSDSGKEDDQKANDETCLVARASSEICLGVDLEPDEWIKDSVYSKHITGNQKLFSAYTTYNRGNVIFGSNLYDNIIGKGKICDNKCRVSFSEHNSEITKNGKVIGRGIRKKGLYVIKLENKPKDKICLATIDENFTLWHKRLGHANIRLIQSLASKELVRNLPKIKFDQHFCDACKIRKQAHVNHKDKNIVSTTRCLELLHMDLFDPSVVRSYGGNLYTLVIVDDYSSKAYIILNKHTMKVEKSLNVTFDETFLPSKTLPLVDDDLDEEEAIKVTEKKNLENDIEDETLEIDDVVNIKESKNHPLENVIGNLNQRNLRSQAQNEFTWLESIRILLDYACALDFKLFQLDIKSAFLNGFINEEVYVAQPLRFIDYEKPDHVYKLKKALCGLKQAPKACLLYLKASRPDIMFSVCLCACFQEDPKTSHLEAVKRIFRYIKGTTHLGLWYPKGTGIETVVYADSDHTGDYADQKALEILYVHRMLSNIMVLEETNRS